MRSGSKRLLAVAALVFFSLETTTTTTALLSFRSATTTYNTNPSFHRSISLPATNSNSNSNNDQSSTDCLTSKSGLPVCRYALGGAARSSQPKTLVPEYCQAVQSFSSSMAPFFFYYNPHRYPEFMQGIYELTHTNNGNGNDDDDDDDNDIPRREDLFLASGGTGRSFRSMEDRLKDALRYCGGNNNNDNNNEAYLDLFVLEYVCPEEIDDDDFLQALEQARSWIAAGKVRYVAASTHSHHVGAWLASLRHRDDDDDRPLLDAMMLRYNMAHKRAAERLSFPACSDANIPVLAFTTTRWNKLQAGHPDYRHNKNSDDALPPTTPDCLSFALQQQQNGGYTNKKGPTTNNNNHWPVQIVLHSARDEDELHDALQCLSSSSVRTKQAESSWRNYGDLNWNDLDGFDEYPEEQFA